MKPILGIREKSINKVVLLSIYDIEANPSQPRKFFNTAQLQSLADSIKQNGILQPITVRRKEAAGKYELISGERRLRAAKLAGQYEVPCIIMRADEEKSAVLALLENVQREDLSFIEEAKALALLMEKTGFTQDELAKKLGKAQSTVANKLRLLKFSSAEMELLSQGMLTERHARALLRLEEPDTRKKALEQVIHKKYTVAQTENYIKALLNRKKKPSTRIFVVKDIRIFFNTINRAIDTMKKAGIAAEAVKQENSDFIEYTVKIPIERARA